MLSPDVYIENSVRRFYYCINHISCLKRWNLFVRLSLSLSLRFHFIPLPSRLRWSRYDIHQFTKIPRGSCQYFAVILAKLIKMAAVRCEVATVMPVFAIYSVWTVTYLTLIHLAVMTGWELIFHLLYLFIFQFFTSIFITPFSWA